MEGPRGKQISTNLKPMDLGLDSNESHPRPPAQIIRFDDVPLSVEVVVNQLAQDIIMIRFKHSIAVFHFKPKGDRKEASAIQNEQEPKYECTKIHELNTDSDECIETAGISPIVSLHLNYQKLKYAFGIYNTTTVYIVDFEESIPDVLSKRQYIHQLQRYVPVDNQAACIQIKFDKDQSRFIACLTDAPSCNVWDSKQGLLLSSLALKEKGVSVCWHTADAFKVMVALREGTVLFYNFIKQQSIQSVNVGKAPILSVDWAPSNSCFIGCTSHTNVHIIDVAKPYSSQFRTVEAHPYFTSHLKFSPWDCKLLATSARSDGSVKVFKLNQQNLLWKTVRMEVQDIEWTAGGLSLLVASGKSLCVFKAQL